MTVSTHLTRLTIAGRAVDVADASLTLDADQNPYAVLTATVPLAALSDGDVATNGHGQFGTRDIFNEDPESWWFNPHGIPGPADTVLVDGMWVTTWNEPSSAYPLPHSRTSFQYVPALAQHSYTASTRIRADVDLLTATMVVEMVREGGWFDEVGRFTVPNVPAGEWAQLAVEFAAPTGARYVHVHVETRAVDGYEVGDTLVQDGVTMARTLSMDALDPRQTPPPPVSVGLTQAFSYGNPLADISADYAGATLADLARVETDFLLTADFEDGLDGFTGTNPNSAVWPNHESILTLSTERAHSGAQSVHVQAVNPTNVWMMFGPPAPIPPGKPFFADAWFYWTGTGPAAAATMVEFYDADGQWVAISYGTAHAAPVGTWNRVRGDIEVPDNPAIATARLVVYVSAAGATDVWFDDVTFRFARLGLSSLTSEYGRALNPRFGFAPSTRVRANLHLRRVSVGHQPGTVAIEAASADSLLLDYSLVATSAMTPTGSTIRDCVNMVLLHVLGVALPAGDTGGELVDTEALPWQPGEGSYDYLNSIVAMGGYRLWCDERGTWRLEDPELVVPPSRLAGSALTAVDLTEEIDRAGGLWCDAAVVTYEWEDSNGTSRRRHDAAGITGSRTATATVQRPYPGSGMARGMVRKGQSYGRVVGYTGVSNYDVRPYWAVQFDMPDGSIQQGVISQVRWDLPADEMTVTTRWLLGITEHSYLYTPPGVAYDDVPAGVSYDDYQWTG
ncbi:hypothetical protein [Jiangella gansuensis]|uniref:hypothetical protein n=1 Tax=Jiangella gansuensis TaxID=281473 RepID=UPI00047E73CF|nr:hypothetical protein [Jiangella gansuensis]